MFGLWRCLGPFWGHFGPLWAHFFFDLGFMLVLLGPLHPAIGHSILSRPGGLREHGLGPSERDLGNQNRLPIKTMKIPSAESRLRTLFLLRMKIGGLDDMAKIAIRVPPTRK